MATAQVLLPGWRSRRRSRTGALRSPRTAPAGCIESGDRSTSPNSIRCSVAPTSRSAPKSAACTRARRWRNCWRCRRVEFSSVILLMDTFAEHSVGG